MPKISWVLERETPTVVDVTSSVLSFSYQQGRRNYLDSYSGGILTVTLNNQTNVAQYFGFNDVFNLEEPVTGYRCSFWVQNVVFNDYPGNTGMSTITVSLADVLARNGRNVVTNVSLAQKSTLNQLEDLWRTSGYQIGDVANFGAGQSVASAQTYTGSILNYFNLITSTEKSGVRFQGDVVQVIARNFIADFVSGFTFTRNSPTASAIAYQTLKHNKAGLNFINNVTIAPQGLAQQTATNSASFTAYGNAQETITTVDATTTQALGLAQWLAFSQSNPETESWSVGFVDLIQNQTALNQFLDAFIGSVNQNLIWDLVYRVPGAGSDTTESVAIEGIAVNANPEQTTFEVFFSPTTYYQFFTLNSTTLGILDTSRLGW